MPKNVSIVSMLKWVGMSKDARKTDCRDSRKGWRHTTSGHSR
jgi:hypothetical protein